jgi:diguanylate cyclase (GGDEF)-like protein
VETRVTVGAPGRPDLVLVVDDDVAMRESLVDLIHLEGLRTVEAGRVDEALELFATRRPAVVVLDHHLPDGTGIELAKQIKDRDPETPVLLLTGFASLDTAAEAVGRLDAYLIKPVAPKMFLKTVGEALGRRRSASEQRHQVDELRRQTVEGARVDPLTGLLNRLELDACIRQGAALCKVSGRELSVFFIGLDRFKQVNDVFGHEVGDELLKEMGRRLVGACTASDWVARFAGDTFVICCPHAVDEAESLRDAERLLEAISRPVKLGGVEHVVTASIGLVVTPPSSAEVSTESVLRDAEIAMFQAKQAGSGCVVLFEPAMRAVALERFEVERGLRTAPSDGTLSLVYQPIVDAHSGRVAGTEALLRWDRPNLGTMLPDSFLDVAEASGLVVAMGAWALDCALADLSSFASRSVLPETFRTWVNVSPQQLALPHFAEVVYDSLERHHVTPDLLGLEILEQALLDLGETERALQALRAMGVALNLDDFGAGHSNLWLLQELPINGIKIDHRFISTIEGGDGDRSAAIAQGLVQLGHALGLSVTAEGVETAEQAAVVDALGCDLAQGYHYGFPGSAEQLWQLIAFEQSAQSDPAEAAG